MTESGHHPPYEAGNRLRLGVSACLLGQNVRYDAGHKRVPIVADYLSEYFELVPVCPEVAIGLGTPRAPIHLTGSTEAPRAVGVIDAMPDVTDRLADYGRRMAGELAGISGYVLKSKSPSCGMEGVPVHGPEGESIRNGRGIYAAEIMRALPLLPVEEEGRLHDPARRESFIRRVYAYHRWQGRGGHTL